MNVVPMNRPATRTQFERNLFLLRERLKKGRLLFRSVAMAQDLKKIRSLPNGRIDLLSVDELARLNANMMATDVFNITEDLPSSESGDAKG